MVSQKTIIASILPAVLLLYIASASAAQEKDKSDQGYSPAQNGYLGLNTVPSARVDTPGTLRAGISTLDPYLHSYLNAQIATPLALTFRQTSEVSSLTGGAKKLYPGVDLKLRLAEEDTHQPAIALGIQSALGHKRMAGEYLALSKRYNNFDFTTGLGWGRYGTAGHFKNPLAGLSSHFSKDRDYNDETPNKPSNWFTGEDVGFFGGVEYLLPYDGLSLKLDYGADRYVAEKAAFDYKNTSPWGMGINYTHNNWINAGIGIQGTDKVMGRLSIKTSPSLWPLKYEHYNRIPRPIYSKQRPSQTNYDHIQNEASQDNIVLSNIWINDIETEFNATLLIPDNASAPKHVGRASRIIINHTTSSVEKINLTLKTKSLRGSQISLMRSDIEKAIRNKNTSANEIWQNASIKNEELPFIPIILPEIAFSEPKKSPFLPIKAFNTDTELPKKDEPFSFKEWKKEINKSGLRLILDNQISLSEEDSGILRRSALIIEGTTSPFLGFHHGVSLKLNLDDNLDKIKKLRTRSSTPVRSDIYNFTDKAVSFERLYSSGMHSFTSELHTAFSIGFLEEFYAGAGGQILYRPIHSRFAVGGEFWKVYRRNPSASLNLAFSGPKITTGHAHIWYDVPYHDITAKLSAGHYLLGDNGFSIGFEKNFQNGALLSASTTITNATDQDIYGDTTHSYHSLNLSLPLGSLPYIPSGSEIRVRNAPFGRDSGQALDKPFSLYNLTQKFTIDDIASHWNELTD